MMVIESPRKAKRYKARSLKFSELTPEEQEIIRRARESIHRTEPARGRSERRGGWD